MSAPTEALKAIREFVLSVKFDPTGADFSGPSARQTYRRFHALLLWELAVDRDDVQSDIRLYFREFLSDCATAYYLNFVGFYKAARLCSRGSIENLLRVLVASAGENVLEINTIPDLVNRCRQIWAHTPERLEVVNTIYSIYSELCNTVHSVSIDYMSLRIPFDKVSEQNSTHYAENIGIIDRLFKSAGEALFFNFSSLLHTLHFRNADYIRDSVSAEVKRSVQEEQG